MARIVDNRNIFDKVIEEISKTENSYVSVGFHENDLTKSAVKNGRKKKSGQYIADIARQNEFGTDRIPARPFMRPSYDENKKKIDQLIANEYEKILDGKSTVKKSLGLIGLFMEDLIKNKILSIHYPPNAPYTIKQKKSSKPLIDFGQMIASVHSKVVIP